MKCRFKIQILFLLLVLLVNTYSKADPGLKVIPGGKKFTRGNIEFIEDAILKFDTLQLSKSRLKRLEDAYRTWKNEDPSRKNIRMAGFCFVPILEKQAGSTDSIYHFITIGYRVVLTLWYPRPNSSEMTGRLLVDSIGFLGFRNFMEVFEPRVTQSVYLDSILFKKSGFVFSPSRISGNLHHADSLLLKTRECDLIFLDSITYRYLVESKEYFSLNESIEEDRRGIMLMRAVNTPMLEDTESDFYGLYLRSLVFRPLPVPSLASFASAASLTFKYGDDCPPYWYLNNGDQGYLRIIQMVQYSALTLNFRQAPGPSKPGESWLIRLLKIILSLLGLIFILFLTFPPFRKIVGRWLGWDIDQIRIRR